MNERIVQLYSTPCTEVMLGVTHNETLRDWWSWFAAVVFSEDFVIF